MGRGIVQVFAAARCDVGGYAEVIRDIVAEAELADSLGVDFIGVGEHHRPDFAISSPEVMLAAIAVKSLTSPDHRITKSTYLGPPNSPKSLRMARLQGKACSARLL